MNQRHRAVLAHMAANNVIRDDWQYRVLGRIGECSDTVYELEEMGFVTLRRDGSYSLTNDGSKLAAKFIEAKKIARASRLASASASFLDGTASADHS